MGSLMPARDPLLYPGVTSQDMGRKRKASPSSSSSFQGTFKRQAMGFGANPEANGDVEELVGLGITGMEVFPGVSPDVIDYMRWEEERNRLKREKHEDRMKNVDVWSARKGDVTMEFS